MKRKVIVLLALAVILAVLLYFSLRGQNNTPLNAEAVPDYNTNSLSPGTVLVELEVISFENGTLTATATKVLGYGSATPVIGVGAEIGIVASENARESFDSGETFYAVLSYSQHVEVPGTEEMPKWKLVEVVEQG